MPYGDDDDDDDDDDINCQNFMILILYMFDFENREYTKFQFNWFISFQDINFIIKFYMSISKCSMRFRF